MKRFKIALETNTATEGFKGAAIGFLIANIPGAIVGHYWQEYLIEKEKREKSIQEELDKIHKDLEKPGAKQKEEFLQFQQKNLKEEIKQLKVKVKEEEELNKKIQASKDKK